MMYSLWAKESKTKGVESWRERRQVGGDALAVIGEWEYAFLQASLGMNPAIDGRRPPASLATPAAYSPGLLPLAAPVLSPGPDHAGPEGGGDLDVS